MNPDALVLATLAIADFWLIVYLRQRHAKREQMERIAASLRMAVRRENDVEELPAKRPLLLRAG